MNEARSASSGEGRDRESRADKLARLENDRLFNQIYATLDDVVQRHGQWQGISHAWKEAESTTTRFGRPEWIMLAYQETPPTGQEVAYVALQGEDQPDGTPTQYLYFLNSEGEGRGRIQWYHERAIYTEEDGQKVWCDGEDIASGSDLDYAERQELLTRIIEIENELKGDS